jgi:hypothetical protein
MTRRSNGRRIPSRRGAALLVAVVALLVAVMIMASITWQCLAQRRQLDQRAHQLQAESLARAGVEWAAARLLADSANYKGESVELIPESEVRIEIRAEPATDLFHVKSEARYPRDARNSVLRSVTRTLRRQSRGNEVHLEVVFDAASIRGAGEEKGEN